MDRLSAWTIFAAVAEHGGFAAAARRLGRSPAAVTRAVAILEERLATRLFNRTTRHVALTEEGARYLERCRRVLAEFDALEAPEPGEEPRGALGVTAPIVFGRLHVLPVVTAFLCDHPAVDVRLLLVDRVVSLLDEGLDVAVRLGPLPDSSLRALRAGTVRRAVYASPDYLERHGVPRTPSELAAHETIAFAAVAAERWVFRAGARRLVVTLKPRLAVNTAEAALDAAAEGLGLTRVLSYQAEAPVAAGRLRPVLERYEPPPVPIHILHPGGRHLPARTRLFIDRLAAALQAKFGGAAPD
jgi:DNA-binding transcriptional LysR family regulator